MMQTMEDLYVEYEDIESSEDRLRYEQIIQCRKI